MIERVGIRRGPPLGRHVAVMGVILLLWFVFVQVSYDGYLYVGESLNSLLADISVVLLCLVLILGPVARFVPKVRPLVPWGRELGIGMFVTGSLHVLILLWGGWDVLGFFFERDLSGPAWLPTLGSRRMNADMGGAANWVGLLALGYALVLAATSNDWSQRRLGRGWKFIQRQAYTLFVLVCLHTVVFLIFGHGSGFALWFWTFAILVIVAQFAGFVHTVGSPRAPSPQGAPPKAPRSDSEAVLRGAAKWAAVTVLWGGLIVGSLSLAAAEDPDVIRFCERYEEVKDQEQLADYVPPGRSIGDFIEECEGRQGE